MKNNVMKLLVIIFAFVMMIFVAKSLREHLLNKETKIVDSSDNKYITDHFSKNCRSDFKYSVRNKDDILYIDGNSVHRYSDKQTILENVNVKKMLYTDSYLYVLDEDCLLYIIDMKQFEKYELSDVVDFEYDGNNLSFKRVSYKNGSLEDEYIVYIPETEIIKDGAVVKFDKMSMIDGELNLEHYIYGNYNERYRTWFESREQSYVTRMQDERFAGGGIPVDDDYYFSNANLAVASGNVYLLCRKYNANSTSGRQTTIEYDVIYSLDFDSEKADEIYKTENNLNRIVGFDDEKNIVYLYDVNNNQINVLDLNTNQTEKIDTLQRKYNSLIFDMNKDILFVYTDNNELVKIVELNK